MVGLALALPFVADAEGTARGDDGRCSEAAVDPSATWSPEWAAASRALNEQLTRMPLAECEHVTLSLHQEGAVVRVVAVAADGRIAERNVSQPSALAPTALGLLESIPHATSNEPLARPPSSPASSGATSATPAAGSTVVVTSPSPAVVWLGFAAGARIGQPTSLALADLEGRADLLLGRWLLFASFRYTPVGITSELKIDADQYNEIAVGLGAGRRFAIGDTLLDVAFAPLLVAMTMETDVPQDVAQSSVEFRIDGSIRWALPLPSSWRLTLTADADLAPADIGGAVRLDPRLPPLPVWTAGLRIGGSAALQ